MTDAPDPLALDNQLCFHLYAASRAMTRAYRPLLDALDLTYPQYLVLLVLWETGEIPFKELGRRLTLDSGTLTPLVKRLEARGLVRRERMVEDERKTRIVLEPEGLALRERAVHIPYDLSCALGLGLDDIEALREPLKAFVRHLTDR